MSKDSTAPRGKPAPGFFESMNCEYQVPNASAMDLMNDCSCLFGAGLEQLEARADDFDPAAFGTLYLLRQAHGLFKELQRRWPDVKSMEVH